MTPEGNFKIKLIEELKQMFPGCIVLRTDPQHNQGIPDLVVLFEDRWAALETKAQTGSARRPNQGYWVDYMNNLSFGAFISPQNKRSVLDGLQQAFGFGG